MLSKLVLVMFSFVVTLIVFVMALSFAVTLAIPL
jgi:hypothetical protein